MSSQQEEVERIVEEGKSLMADVFKGRLSALLVDDWLRTTLTSLTEAHNKQTGELLKEIMKFVTDNQKDDGTIYPKVTSHAVVCFLQKKAKEFNIEVK